MRYESDYQLSDEHRGALRKAKHQVHAGLFALLAGAVFLVAALHSSMEHPNTPANPAGFFGLTAFISGIALLVKGSAAESRIRKKLRNDDSTGQR